VGKENKSISGLEERKIKEEKKKEFLTFGNVSIKLD
jgi:hypothetical protein